MSRCKRARTVKRLLGGGLPPSVFNGTTWRARDRRRAATPCDGQSEEQTERRDVVLEPATVDADVEEVSAGERWLVLLRHVRG